MIVCPVDRVGGEVRVPGDKSVSHRALLLSALAMGPTRVSGLGLGGDVRSTRRVLEGLGVQFETLPDGDVVVRGRGFQGLAAPTAPLDCGNSGTTLRVMMGVLAGRPFQSTLVGDASLSRRPMERVAAPLRTMGARITTTAGCAPVHIAGISGAVGDTPLSAIDFASPVASAQVKTAVLLAGLQAHGRTTVTEPALSRDHTERMLAGMGAHIACGHAAVLGSKAWGLAKGAPEPSAASRLSLEGRMRSPGAHDDAAEASVSIEASPLTALGRFVVPGDLSSAAFWLAAGLLVDGPGLAVVGALVNPSRTGFLDIVAAMGGNIVREDSPGGVEPTATLTARRSPLRAITVGGDLVLRAIDEVPILAVLATQAEGTTVIRDAGELRVKESDRLAVMAQTLRTLGARIRELPDGLEIDGPTPLHGGSVHAELDHRIAMSAAIAALTATSSVSIHGADAAAVSYPAFWRELARLAPGSVDA